MEFNKYKESGDYHHRLYEEGKDPYALHADRVAKWIDEGRTLDVGAGDGLITSLIPGAVGIDDNECAVKLAKEHGVDVRLLSVYDLSKRVFRRFNNILLADVIEHLEFPEKAIRACRNVMEDDGCLYVTTPPAIGNGKLHDSYHYREYTAEELKHFIEQFGFRLTGDIETANVRIYAKFRKL